MTQQGKESLEGIRRATFIVDGTEIPVHFNPESLTLTMVASIVPRGLGDTSASPLREPPDAAQHATTFAQTLAMKLLFDTSETGADVRVDTIKFQRMIRP